MFAVGPDWVQVTWSGLGPGPMTVTAGDHRLDVVADGGPGGMVVDGLPDDCDITVVVRGPGMGTGTSLTTRTLARPPGEELLRIATVNDVHVGSHSTGYFHTIVELPEPAVPHAQRCLAAAVDELGAWGAERLVIKGDLVHSSHQANWDAVAGILETVTVPVDLLPGNHERAHRGDVAPSAAARAMGIEMVDGVRAVDHAGVRIVLADVTLPDTDWGTVLPVADGIVSAARVDGPVLVTIHQQLMRFRFPTYLPPGVPGPQALTMLRALRAANHRTLVTSGHTHRHRRRTMAGVTVSEVGSTKDFPGTWAGYHVHEGGIVQVVRRIQEPSCIRWTDWTRRAAGGVWPRWAPGSLDDRCFTLRW